jgi:uncharacterized protein YaaQ
MGGETNCYGRAAGKGNQPQASAADKKNKAAATATAFAGGFGKQNNTTFIIQLRSRGITLRRKKFPKSFSGIPETKKSKKKKLRN